MNHCFIKSVLVGALMAGSAAVYAATETATSSVKWNAEAVKKSDVSLNVFASADTLAFRWDETNKRFSIPQGYLTIQAAGKTAATAYKITSQLMRNELVHVTGRSTGLLYVFPEMGGTYLYNIGEKNEILAGTNAGVTSSAKGFEGMNLAAAGPNATANGSYHEAQATMYFTILAGDSGGMPVIFGEPDMGLELLPDGTYEGTIEVGFTASWVSP
ncbi:MAG: common pilus major fimbrillin subunit EcpA [Iodobacter sp.]